HVALSEASGEITLAGLAAHSGLPGSIRDSPGVSLGTRGLLGGLPEVVYGSGTQGQMARSGDIRGNPPGLGYSGTRGGSGRIREGRFSLGTQEHVAGSEDVSKEASGMIHGRASET